MRDYRVMREAMVVIGGAGRELRLEDFRGIEPSSSVPAELQRLKDDGLVEGDVAFDRNGLCVLFRVEGLTAEGRAFLRLIEGDGAWEVMLGVLKSASIDVPYPLLKEVCEEIVKRYVTSFIPDVSEIRCR